jgi:hypothetical protein
MNDAPECRLTTNRLQGLRRLLVVLPMEKLDTLVADHIEHRLLQPSRLEKILSSVLDRREERAGCQTMHIAELRKRAAEVGAKLKRLYDAIENGVTDLSDPMLKDRIAELKAIRDQAHADAERAEGAIERQGPTITRQSIKAFARTARKRMRTEAGGYPRIHPFDQVVEVFRCLNETAGAHVYVFNLRSSYRPCCTLRIYVAQAGEYFGSLRTILHFRGRSIHYVHQLAPVIGILRVYVREALTLS